MPMKRVREIVMGSWATGVKPDCATVAGVYDILLGMRRCRINLSNRCYHLISRGAHRAMAKDGKRRIERVAPL